MGFTALADAATATGMDNVLSAMDTVMNFGSKVLEFAIGNPVLCFFLACTLAGAGISVIARIKSFAAS